MKRRSWPSTGKSRTLVFIGVLALSGTALVQAQAQAQSAVPTFTVTSNAYDGSQWWGTISFTNNGPVASTSYSVEFDVPSGVHCTAESDAVPAGATLSPLTGSGSSAHTISNHCVFTWASSALAPGASKTFNYSTDSQKFSSASHVTVDDNSSGGMCSTFEITKNSYDGSQWWGTLSFKNNGVFSSSNYKVEFDVPFGFHCTNDYVPPGAVLSPLAGSGSSARTVANHCVFTWTNTTLLTVGSTKTFNYSTDSQSFKSASNVRASDPATCSGPAMCMPNGSLCDPLDTEALCCSNACICSPQTPSLCNCAFPVP